MKVLNIHTRSIAQPVTEVWELIKTLSSDDDKVIATNKWPRMILDNGLKVGSKGGHGPIRYTICEFSPEKSIVFEFTRPAGFNGIHKFEVAELNNNKTELKHTIQMTTSVKATVQWLVVIRWLHDAYVEDAFDKVEEQLTEKKIDREWNLWVKLLRKLLSR